MYPLSVINSSSVFSPSLLSVPVRGVNWQSAVSSQQSAVSHRGTLPAASCRNSRSRSHNAQPLPEVVACGSYNIRHAIAPKSQRYNPPYTRGTWNVECLRHPTPFTLQPRLFHEETRKLSDEVMTLMGLHELQCGRKTGG